MVATNPITQVAVREFQVNITQIDNSKFPEVTLLVSVTDLNGNPLVVNPDFFKIEENGNPVPQENIIRIVQKKVADQQQQAKPLNIVLTIDKSGSMKGGFKIREKQPIWFAQKAAVEFIKQAGENDLVKVIAFSGDLYPLGANEGAIPRIEKLQAKGSTVLYGALLSSVKELQFGGGIKAVIFLTDGKNDTRGTLNETLKSITLSDGIHAANQLAIPVFTIGFGKGADDHTLKEIAKRTHALYFKTGKKEEISKLYMQIREIINTQYLVTYNSESLREVTDVKALLGKYVDRRTFTTPANVVKREKKLRKEIQIVQNERDRLSDLEKKLNTRTGRLNKKEQSLEEEKAVLKEQERKFRKQLKKLEQKEAELNRYDQKVKIFETKVKNKENRLVKLKDKLDSKKATLDELQRRLANLSAAQSKRTDSLDSKDQKLNEKEKFLKKEHDKIRSEKAKINELKITLENKETRLNRKIASNKELKERLKQDTKANVKQKARLKKLQDKLDNRMASLNEKEKRLNELNTAQINRSNSLDSRDQKLREKDKFLKKELKKVKLEKAKLNEYQIALEKKEVQLSRDLKSNKSLQANLKQEKNVINKEKERLNKLAININKILKELHTKYKRALEDVSGQKTKLEALQP